MITATINGQLMTLSSDLVVSDSVEYLKISLSFSEDWDGTEKTALFRNDSLETPVSLLLNSDNEVSPGVYIVPHEVIKAPKFTLSVFGTKGDELITTGERVVPVVKSGYGSGVSPDEPTPSVYQQLLNSTKAAYIGDDGYWYEFNKDSGEFVKTDHVAQGQPGAQGIQGGIGPKGDKGDPGDPLVVDQIYNAISENAQSGLALDPEFKKKQDKFGEVQEIDDGYDSKLVTGNVMFHGSTSQNALVDLTNARIRGSVPWVYDIPEDATFSENNFPNVKYVDDAVEQAIASNNESYYDKTVSDSRYLNTSYELIETITLLEDTESVLREKDINGVDYNFKAVAVIVNVPTTTYTSTLRIDISGGTPIKYIALVYGSSGIGNSNRRTIAMWEKLSNTLFVYGGGVENTKNQVVPTKGFNIQNEYYEGAQYDGGFCNRIRILPVTTSMKLPAGTVIKIYGARANEN